MGKKKLSPGEIELLLAEAAFIHDCVTRADGIIRDMIDEKTCMPNLNRLAENLTESMQDNLAHQILVHGADPISAAENVQSAGIVLAFLAGVTWANAREDLPVKMLSIETPDPRKAEYN